MTYTTPRYAGLIGINLGAATYHWPADNIMGNYLLFLNLQSIKSDPRANFINAQSFFLNTRASQWPLLFLSLVLREWRLSLSVQQSLI